MTSILLRDYIDTIGNTAAELSRKTGLSTQRISWWLVKDTANVWIDYTVKTGCVNKIWRENHKVVYEKAEA